MKVTKNKINNILIIIPARGGSKRIPYKNIKEINGKPMIYWPINEILKKFTTNEILVSTDDDLIIKTLKEIGITTPFKRPQELSDDYTTTMSVAKHALKWHEKHKNIVEIVLIIYPTAVLLNIEDLTKAIQLLKEDKQCDYVMSATTFPFPIQRAVFNNKDGYAKMFKPENYTKRSQDFVEAFHDAGQFYVCKSETVREEKNLENCNAKLFQLNRNNVIDIDTLEDFKIAEEKLKTIKK